MDATCSTGLGKPDEIHRKIDVLNLLNADQMTFFEAVVPFLPKTMHTQG